MLLTTARRRAIIAAHGGVCHYCGMSDAAHVDHIIPRADGGTDDLGNLIAACLPCNMLKNRHRLPAKAERLAMDAAEAAREKIREIERALPVQKVGRKPFVRQRHISHLRKASDMTGMTWEDVKAEMKTNPEWALIGYPPARGPGEMEAYGKLRAFFEAKGIRFDEAGRIAA